MSRLRRIFAAFTVVVSAASLAAVGCATVPEPEDEGEYGTMDEELTSK